MYIRGNVLHDRPRHLPWRKILVTRTLTRDLFAVANVLVCIVVPVEDRKPFDSGSLVLIIMIAVVVGVLAVIAAIVCYRRRRKKTTEGE